MNIETERLLLRPLESTDAPDVQQLAGDREVASTTRDIPHPYEDGVAEAWITACQDEIASGDLVNFAITLRSDGSFLGVIGLHLNTNAGDKNGDAARRDANKKAAELSYWVGRPFWDQGYATEAVKAVLRHGLTELGLDRVYAAHFTRNPASGRVMQKAGMHHEGFLKAHTEKWGKFEDLELYGITSEQFLGS